MFNLLKVKVKSANFIIERLHRLSVGLDVGLELAEEALVVLFLFTVAVLLDSFQEVVDVHALVDVQEEGHPLTLRKRLQV